jgi:hypothetical protein
MIAIAKNPPNRERIKGIPITAIHADWRTVQLPPKYDFIFASTLGKYLWVNKKNLQKVNEFLFEKASFSLTFSIPKRKLIPISKGLV